MNEKGPGMREEQRGKKYQESVKVLASEMISDGIFSLWLHSPGIAEEARPGQFLSLYCGDKSRLLPRPISICELRKDEGGIRLVYRAAGEGTREFSRLRSGDTIDVIGPLGNGFPFDAADPGTGKKSLLAAGGIGVPPMVELARQLPGEKVIAAGYRDRLFLTEELENYGKLFTATEDGSAGTKGTVLDCIRENQITADVIYACGPMPMLRALAEYAKQEGIPCWVSLEQRMACGIGACLACVCKSSSVDEHTKVKNKRICVEGPVFAAEDVFF